MVTDQGQNLMAGMREISSNDAETRLNILLDILSEIEKSPQNMKKKSGINIFHQ